VFRNELDTMNVLWNWTQALSRRRTTRSLLAHGGVGEQARPCLLLHRRLAAI